MKGYWINHVLDVKDPDRFMAYADASGPLFQGDNKYGAQLKLFGPVAASVIGEAVQHAAVVEFESLQAAIDFWDDPEYAAARALMGADESAVVDRRVCCIEAAPFTVVPGQGVWVNHVHEIVDEAAFFAYANASMQHFSSASFGPVMHQHAGQQRIQLAAVLGFDHVDRAVHVYSTPEYREARAAGGMADSEAHVVHRTICAVSV